MNRDDDNNNDDNDINDNIYKYYNSEYDYKNNYFFENDVIVQVDHDVVYDDGYNNINDVVDDYFLYC